MTMEAIYITDQAARENAVPIYTIKTSYRSESSVVPEEIVAWMETTGFDASPGAVLKVPTADGKAISSVCLGVGDEDQPLCAGSLSSNLPKGAYYFAESSTFDQRLASIGFGLGAYRFAEYRSVKPHNVGLILDEQIDHADIRRTVEATWLVRDLVNTPANDMGPQQIEAAARRMAKPHKADVKVTVGDALLTENLPMIHAVGRASTSAPRLIDIRWGKKSDPLLTLVGKGVAFDNGGLNIKPASGMRNMKKDMGGAANVLGLASMVMSAKLPVRLRVLIPAVENAISGNAFRPGDILTSRLGATVEIGNTDAEGRLILADALALADEEAPAMLIDMATLTGAARVALGPDLPPFYTEDDDFAQRLSISSREQHDPLWRMPLWEPYTKNLHSSVADLCNITNDGFAGSVTAALFLKRFVEKAESWTHLDIFAWTPKAKPHAPVGGEAQGVRALYDALRQRFG